MKRKKQGQPKPSPGWVKEIHVEELQAILHKARTSVLTDEDCDKLGSAVDTLAYLTQALEAKNASIQRLRYLMFGPRSSVDRRCAPLLAVARTRPLRAR